MRFFHLLFATRSLLFLNFFDRKNLILRSKTTWVTVPPKLFLKMDAPGEGNRHLNQMSSLARELEDLHTLNSSGWRQPASVEIQSHRPTAHVDHVRSTRDSMFSARHNGHQPKSRMKRTFENLSALSHSFTVKGATKDDAGEIMAHVSAVGACLREGVMDEQVASRPCPDELHDKDFTFSIKVQKPCLFRESFLLVASPPAKKALGQTARP
jgi:hypothetical protein